MKSLWHQWKYLIAYLIPVSALTAMLFGEGITAYRTVIIAFVIIPVLEILLKGNGGNVEVTSEQKLSGNRIFDLLLYLNLPLLWAVILLYADRISNGSPDFTTWLGLTLCAGIVAGASGINVAHELGHRENRTDQWFARLLLLPEFYQHFTIEHNYGHHKNVATSEDPATARKGENVFSFWWRSITRSWLGAWNIENNMLKKAGRSFWSLHNRMLLFTVMPVIYLGIMGWIFGPEAMFGLMIVGLVGVLLLETINYIEHYGLLREKLPNGRYEPVDIRHSWNSNHDLGRIFLYELTRHADHHDKANRKYPVLRHFDESPQLPLGYPTSILMSLVPPLWFYVMDRRLPGAGQLALN